MRGSIFTIHYAPPAGAAPAPDTNGDRASGNLEVTRYLAPVVDDDAPRSLQPFLQRTSTLYMNFGGGGFVTHNPNDGPDRTDSNLALNLGLDVYLTRWFALTAAAGYGYDVLHDVGVDDKTHSFTGSAGFGFRVADARFDAVYTFTAYDDGGSFAPLRWGTVQLTAFAVFARCFTLNLWGEAIQSGGAGGVDLGYYPSQNVGLFLGGYGERGEIFSSDDAVDDRFGAHVGASYWMTPRARISLYYYLTDVDAPPQIVNGAPYGYGQIEHQLGLFAAARLP